MPDGGSDIPCAPADSFEVRERLVEALNLDLIGPRAGHDLASERLPGWVRPSNRYLTGFLIRNIELGVLIRDRALAASVISHFRGLIDRGLLSPLPAQ